MRRLSVFIIPIVFGLSLLATTPEASAQSSGNRYSSWNNPDSAAGAVDPAAAGDFAKELRDLVDEAEKSRAANPVLLRDLRALADRYDNPWNAQVFYDDFRDGDFTRDPAWAVTSGEFWVERGYGLRSVIEPGAAAPASSANTSQKVSKNELAAAVFGAVLNRALGGKQQAQQPAQQQAPAPAQRAAIHVAKTLPNAFAIKAEITAWQKNGEFAIGPYQGLNGQKEPSAGYKLIYRGGADRSLELVRYNSRGVRIVDTYDKALDLADQAVHVFEWTRTTSGDMVIQVDGKALIRTNDRGFRDAFSGFAMENSGGDNVLARLSVHGAK